MGHPQFANNKIKYDPKRGAMALMSVLVIGAIGLGFALFLFMLGLITSTSSFVFQQSFQARELAHSCAEEALEQIRESALFTGSGNLTFGAATCAYSVIDTGGETKRIEATGHVGEFLQMVRVEIIAINPQIQISSWREVASF